MRFLDAPLVAGAVAGAFSRLGKAAHIFGLSPLLVLSDVMHSTRLVVSFNLELVSPHSCFTDA